MERDRVDWTQIYREALPLPMGGAGFVVPWASADDLLVVLVPVAKGTTAQARAHLGRSVQLIAQGRSLWRSVQEVWR